MNSSIDGLPEKKPRLPFIFSPRPCGLCAAAGLMLVALFFIIQALQLSLGSLRLPGPGFFPLILGVALLVLSGWAGLAVWGDTADQEPVELGHRDVIITLLLTLAVPILFESLGAYLTLGGFSFLMLVLIARTRIVTAAAATVLAMIFTWLFFQKMLGVSLPWGVLADVVNR